MKKVLVFFSIIAVTLVLVAFGNSVLGSSEEEAMQFYVSGDTIEGSALTKMSKKYTEETGVKIEVVDVPYSDMITKLNNMIRAEQPPALARVTGFNPGWRGSLLDLQEVAEKNNVRTELGITVDDQLVAPPLDLTAVGMFINVDLFEEAGVTFPTSEDNIWTWDEFLSKVKTVKENTNAKYGMVMDNSEHRLNAFLYQHGSKGFYREDDQYTTNPETKEALQKFVELNNSGMMPKSVWTASEDPAFMFKSGLVPAYMSGSWQITDFASNIKDFEWKAVYMPYEEERSTNLGGNYLTAFKGSGYEEEAKKFIDWLYQKDNYEELASLGGYLPVVEDADVEYNLAPEVYELYNNEIEASAEVANVQRNKLVRKQLVAKRSLKDVLANEMINTLNGQQSLDKAIENVESQMTETYIE
ncbi:sugar ABC transporter substrate-binding protein [Gracilibacillus oryzae]|uniref:Sugar ABC transporter substrate-binding protein n=1 Tax=Gracilibacillus oryzae TaxID=1672701 RepID=A0A7C8GR00_9BACI|nr:sugar ABC transporter substrate-binding protein [Gracilibacillus oryzae]KAB8126328.1 sugar ABC transporter substrate-binding protein [Gracilibacillus oryzae]